MVADIKTSTKKISFVSDRVTRDRITKIQEYIWMRK